MFLKHRFRFVIAAALFLTIISQNLCSFDMVYSLNAMVVTARNDSHADVSEEEICKRSEPIEKIHTSLDYKLLVWDSQTQGLVLSAFPVGAIFGTLVSIWIYDFFYLRILFPGGLFMGALNSLVLPDLAHRGHTPSTITNRLFSGFYTGIMAPGVAIATMTWFPFTERGRVQTSVMLGSNFGKLLFALSGSLIQNFGWPAMFHTTGGIGVIVSILCFIVYNDNPADSPCLSKKEESIIFDLPTELLHTISDKESHAQMKEAMKDSWRWLPRVLGKFVRGIHIKVKKPIKRVKWSKVMTSTPYWATVLAHFGVKYVTGASITYTQIYLQNIHGYTLTYASILTSV